MEIKVYATLRDVVGGPRVHLDGDETRTVGQMLEALYTRYPELRAKLEKSADELHSAIHILINGRDMRFIDGLDTPVEPGDEVRIFPPVGGGRWL